MSNTTQIDNRIQKIEAMAGNTFPVFCAFAELYEGEPAPEGKTIYDSREELVAAFVEEKHIKKPKNVIKLCIRDHSGAGLKRKVRGYYR